MEPMVRSLMNIIQSEVSDMPFDAALFLSLSDKQQEALAALAKRHSIAQLVGDALGKCPETKDLPVTKALFPSTMMAVMQVEKLEQERKKICAVLEQAEIPYIQLKGARIRSYYPQPWMRLSCDNDILVHEEDVDRAASLLCEKLEYKLETRNYHDLSLFAPNGTHLELHFSIKENIEKMDRILLQVWENSKSVSSSETEWVQSDSFFLFHLLAHMAYHFVSGGCGIRAFLDLYVLRQHFSDSDAVTQSFCRKAGIDRFVENVRSLLNVWFDSQPHTELTRRMERFVFSGGTFGTNRNHVTVKRNQCSSKGNYICKRLFLSFAGLSIEYPVLKRHRWLMPFCQLHRWFSALFGKRAQRAKKDLQIVKSLKKEELSEVELMLRENGLL